jgi:hypothetical protein
VFLHSELNLIGKSAGTISEPDGSLATAGESSASVQLVLSFQET